MGFKGESNMDSGYVLAPYVPFSVTPSCVGDERCGLLTRYGKKLFKAGSKYYGKILVSSGDSE
jgi:hypothetical protein